MKLLQVPFMNLWISDLFGPLKSRDFYNRPSGAQGAVDQERAKRGFGGRV